MLSASCIAGTDTVSGRHGFSLHLPDDYQAQSSNPNRGTYPFINGQALYITSGALQLIPPSFATSYEGRKLIYLIISSPEKIQNIETK